MKNRIVKILMLGIILIMILTGCSVSDAESEESQAQTEKEQTDKENFPKLNEGSDAPDFTAELYGGGSFCLSDKQEKVVLLNFWASWCGPCVGEMPALQKLYEDYGDELEILAVNTAEDKDTVDAFMADSQYTFPIAYDENGEISRKYPTDGIPYTLIIDKDGKVASIFLGSNGADEQYKKFQNAINEALSR